MAIFIIVSEQFHQQSQLLRGLMGGHHDSFGNRRVSSCTMPNSLTGQGPNEADSRHRKFPSAHNHQQRIARWCRLVVLGSVRKRTVIFVLYNPAPTGSKPFTRRRQSSVLSGLKLWVLCKALAVLCTLTLVFEAAGIYAKRSGSVSITVGSVSR